MKTLNIYSIKDIADIRKPYDDFDISDFKEIEQKLLEMDDVYSNWKDSQKFLFIDRGFLIDFKEGTYLYNIIDAILELIDFGDLPNEFIIAFE